MSLKLGKVKGNVCWHVLLKELTNRWVWPRSSSRGSSRWSCVVGWAFQSSWWWRHRAPPSPHTQTCTCTCTGNSTGGSTHDI